MRRSDYNPLESLPLSNKNKINIKDQTNKESSLNMNSSSTTNTNKINRSTTIVNNRI